LGAKTVIEVYHGLVGVAVSGGLLLRGRVSAFGQCGKAVVVFESAEVIHFVVGQSPQYFFAVACEFCFFWLLVVEKYGLGEHLIVLADAGGVLAHLQHLALSLLLARLLGVLLCGLWVRVFVEDHDLVATRCFLGTHHRGFLVVDESGLFFGKALLF